MKTREIVGLVAATFLMAAAFSGAAETCPGYRDSFRQRTGLTDLLAPSLFRIKAEFRTNGKSEESAGTGFLGSSSGLVITAYHIVKKPYEESEILLSATNGVSQSPVGLSIVHIDESNDLALLQLNEIPTDARPLRLVTQEFLQLNEELLGAGYPLALVQPSVGFGKLLTTDGPNGLITSLPLARGQSGGPVLTQSGEVIGVILSSPDGLGSTVKVVSLAAISSALESQRAPLLRPYRPQIFKAQDAPVDKADSCEALEVTLGQSRHISWICESKTIRPDRAGAEDVVSIPLKCNQYVIGVRYFHRSRGAVGELGENGPWNEAPFGDYPWARIEKMELKRELGGGASVQMRCRNWSDTYSFTCGMGVMVETLMW
jgi:S1-C subfamily serine protease